MSKRYEYNIIPLLGVSPIKFGMTQSESRDAMNEAFTTRKNTASNTSRDYYHESSFQVSFDTDDQVELIELARFPVLAIYNGISVFELNSDEAISLILKDAPFDESNPELGYSYIFPALELSLWRPVLPENDQNINDYTGKYFESIGIGRRGYYSQM